MYDSESDTRVRVMEHDTTCIVKMLESDTNVTATVCDTSVTVMVCDIVCNTDWYSNLSLIAIDSAVTHTCSIVSDRNVTTLAIDVSSVMDHTVSAQTVLLTTHQSQCYMHSESGGCPQSW